MPKKHYHHITDDERGAMTAMGLSGHSEAEIAHRLGRSRSTINRERRRNVCNDGKYRRLKATRMARARRRHASSRPKISRLHWRGIAELVEQDWSPEQIACTLKAEGTQSISHQSIYRRIHTDRQIGGRLYSHLRGSRKQRRKRYGTIENRGRAKGKRTIDDRPESVDRRANRFHWEADTMVGRIGCQHSLVTLVERKTGFTLIGKVKNRKADVVAAKITELLATCHIRVLSITCDNGTEFNKFKHLEHTLGLKIFFADPHSAWQRGTNENTNGLIRQYAPKGHSMKYISQHRCNRIAHRLNHRPRKRLGFKSPYECYSAS